MLQYVYKMQHKIFCSSLRKCLTVNMNPECFIIFVVALLVTFSYTTSTDDDRRDCNNDDNCPTGLVCHPTQRKCYTRDENCVCQQNWTKYEDSCYNAFTYDPFDYYKAKEFCEGLGANIVVPETKEENKFLKGMLRDDKDALGPDFKYINVYYWLGLTKSEKGDYAWDPSRDAPSYDDWSDEGYGGCATYSSYADFKWEQSSCLMPYGRAVCEMIC